MPAQKLETGGQTKRLPTRTVDVRMAAQYLERGMRPRVILHNHVSVDGRVDGFEADVGLHYEQALEIGFEAHLVGSLTILAQAGDLPPEDASPAAPLERAEGDGRPLLVVPDSQGRVRCWGGLRAVPYWRGHVALCSEATPAEHMAYLKEREVEILVAGDERVDLAAALAELQERFGVTRVVVDSGGALNGALLQAGLVDEVSVTLHPSLVGSADPHTLYRPASGEPTVKVPLRLIAVKQLMGGLVWARYEVIRAG